MAQLKVTQIKSKIGGTSAQRNSLRSLGLNRIGQVVVMGSTGVPRHDQDG